MKELLFLAHRIPYPPNKGDKIRSFNLLKHLSLSYRVHLGSFVDAEEDWAYVDQLDAFCASRHVAPLQPMMARLREEFSEPEIVELTVAIGIWDSVHKFNNVFDIAPPVAEGLFTTDPPDVPPGFEQFLIEPGNKYDN